MPLNTNARGTGAVPNYNEAQSAVRVEKLKIWFAWICGNVLMLIIAGATPDIAVVSVITQVLLAVVFLGLTVALFRMTGALNRKADAARREVLGDE
ncbi:hypothetical protein [Streptomyces sp. NPDC056949]|uniref:hypothetical protein n=1 Tax=Streptomyces sp. NPDC056949 TaxID=3345976 RepID=UPI003636A742